MKLNAPFSFWFAPYLRGLETTSWRDAGDEPDDAIAPLPLSAKFAPPRSGGPQGGVMPSRGIIHFSCTLGF
jgi:hypothetical protein